MISVEEVVLVDADDREIGVMEKMQAHRLGLLHRAFSIVLLNNRNEILLQQRAHTKYHSPSLWSNTCCSHPRPGEAIEAAAARRLEEEMGLQCEFRNIFSFTYKVEFGQDLYEHEFDHVFLGQFSGNPNINHDEVAAWKFMDFDAVRIDMDLHPERYTFWFHILMQKLSVINVEALLLS
ncbi:isopentenyl-diphosphate Delta-isomerase [Mucilaginibacter lacusdianchii]|uniref:isopentenyl-diphosphate Delta-isomerase n=1 Tax=Mucilaginibacter lacusdianchii TaxID=2684211 RepID=UPI00131C9989|nr:isopentenyl-diphosphate Delta-isomerase [Mucilaginibacter sp. JXJ CY 39]